MLNDRDALYALLPAPVRQRDIQAGGTLKALLAIAGEQASLIERDLQRMCDNWFVETCEPWVLPYIADLLGYRPPTGAADAPVPATVRTPRREVADWIAHERRKGSLALLEDLAHDIARWPALAVEFYRQLVVAQHLDHLQGERLATADLRGVPPTPAFDTRCRIADMRRSANPQSRGLGNIADIGLFVFRMRHYGVTNTTAYCREEIGPHCYAFSVLGNDLPLYRKPAASRVPLPISRHMLETGAGPDAAPAAADPALVGPANSLSITVEDWPRKGTTTTLGAADIVPADLSTWAYRVPKNHVAVDPERGRIKFAIQQSPRRGVVVSYGHGFAMDIGGGEYARAPLALPARVARRRVRSMEAERAPGDGFRSIAAAIRDWQSKRPHEEAALVVELADSGVYRGRLDLTLGKGESVWIVAAPRTRPVLWLADADAGRADAISVRGDAGSRFALDGVLLVGRGIGIGPLLEDMNGEDADRPDADRHNADRHHADRDKLDRDLCQVLIRHSTLVPGWSIDGNCHARHPSEPSIVLAGSHACLRIEHSIVGPIQAWREARGGEPAMLNIADSVVDATGRERQAIGGPHGEIAPLRLSAARSTLVGEVNVHALALGEDSIFFGKVTVARRQAGCVRYSYVQPNSRTPRRHYCQPDSAIGAAHAQIDGAGGATPAERAVAKARIAAELTLRIVPRFESTDYGRPDYLRLAPDTVQAIARGAADESEMGVYHDLFEPQRVALLGSRLAEYVPAGFHAGVLFAS